MMKFFLRKHFRKISLVLIFLTTAAVVYLLFRTGSLSVKKIIVTTDYDVSGNQKLMKDLNNLKGQIIFLVDKKKLAKEIKNEDLKIASVMINRNFPDQITIEIKKRQGLAVIGQNNSFLIIDKDGVVFDQANDPQKLPILDLSLQNLKIGSRIEGDKMGILGVVDGLKGMEEVRKAVAAEGEFRLELGSGTLIFFPKNGNFEQKIQALQTILTRFKIEGRRAAKIDLRFEKPVVSF